ncbi:(2Fe-2S)-binding protein [Ignatzschineria ureiclastica]|uniref:(2Fe-2S)-binding protein n=1 Tax=Ignatzschineria ureiclastica TaxID=472582 RepID=A0A2U2ACI7_9GAMM|nr:non-heme iron oxygenase ferredoxin subunit [Ignatzschineria ureiclastica]PWD80375.1 (2Fe-2S)-binding protein [Ignatzschineria ureiclastica]GGZ99964.1 Rieske family ferredoxin [Ignatzschineria ureiclastica]
MAKILICSISDVAPGEMRKFETEVGDLLLFNREGEFYVTDDQCTHATASLAEGDYFDDTVSCPKHWGEFNIITGEATAAPCRKPLRTYFVMVEDDQIYVDSEREAAGALKA